MAAVNVVRIHSDAVWPLALAIFSIATRSSGVMRTRSMTAFAFPLGSGGRPAFLGFVGCFKASILLNDCRSYRIHRRLNRA